MAKVCMVFGAGNELPERIVFPDGERVVIAADGGLDRLNALGVVPDHVVGDFDSLGRIPEDVPFTRLPHMKDTTDTFEAVKMGIEQGCTEFRIYGGTGGRLDHTLANIQLAAQLSQKGYTPFIYGESYVLTAVTDGSVDLPARGGGYVSVFAHSDVCEGVTIRGLLYETDGITLRNDFALGVSNEYVGTPAVISVKHGTLCIFSEI